VAGPSTLNEPTSASRAVSAWRPQARNIAKVAMARQLLTCVFYAMRDGQVRSLAAAAARQAA
jgi:hypothetical protein